MADYWKSQDRKYCEFCNCWIADNKPSRDFHEKGRRHLENVKKRLRNITKESAKTQRENDKIDYTLKQMEAAAMAAYRRDVEHNANADLTSISITQKMKDEQLALKDESQKVWNEAKSKEGKNYYWNILTNETVWEKPKEGYLSILEQRQQQDEKAGEQLKLMDKEKRKDAMKLMQIQKAEEEEERARQARERLKARRVVDDIPEPVYGPIIEPGKNDPYGKWQTVKAVQHEDLQLPQQQQTSQFYVPIVTEPEPVKKEFKEKTIVSLDDSSGSSSFGSTFKKRKIVSGAVRNTRKRLDDD